MKSFEIAIWQIIIERWLIEFSKDFPNAYWLWIISVWLIFFQSFLQDISTNKKQSTI